MSSRSRWGVLILEQNDKERLDDQDEEQNKEAFWGSFLKEYNDEENDEY